MRFADYGDVVMSAKDARGLADVYEKQARGNARWRAIVTEFAAKMRAFATECDQKNRDGVVPSDAVAAMPTKGNA